MRVISASLVFALALCLGEVATAADNVSTSGDCSPALVRSVVGGSVIINCSQYRDQLTPLAQSIESIARAQHLSNAQEQRFFDAVNTLLEALLLKDNRLITDVAKVNAGIKHISQVVSDIQAASDTTTNIGNVTSSNQSGGVTADYVGVVNQNPALDRTKFTTPLTGFYAQGVGVRSEMVAATTDAAIEAVVRDATKWATSANTWIFSNMGPAAQALFLDSSNTMSFTYSLPSGSQASSENVQSRNNWMNKFNTLIPNLKMLIASHDYDPPSR